MRNTSTRVVMMITKDADVVNVPMANNVGDVADEISA